MRSFVVPLTHFTFRWSGHSKGPSPLSLQSEPAVWTPSLGQYQYNNSFPPRTPPKEHLYKPSISPTRSSPVKPLRFFSLQHMELENCILDAEQIAAFIARHRGTLVEFRFEDVALRNGDWASTLDPLRKLKKLERTRRRAEFEAQPPRRALKRRESDEETLCDEMDVPCIMVSPVDHEPMIMDTLEPQEMSVPWTMGGLSKNLGMRKWFGGAKSKPNGVKHERKVSDHLKRVLNGGIFAWR